jgi:exodeoxyribonuclease V alpha subunit
VTAASAAAARKAVGELLTAGGLPATLALRAVAVFGEDAARALRQDPWLALELPGVRPVDADRFAVAVADPRPDRGDARRGRAFVGYLLSRAARDGHTVTPVSVLTSALSGLGFPDPGGAITAALDAGLVVDDDGDPSAGPLVGLLRYATAEQTIADGIRRLSATASPLAGASVVEQAAADLDAAQQTAVHAAAGRGISVLTGGPGTGKSRTVAAVVALARARHRRLELAAPTGRAAKRLEELAGHPAATVHRLLGASGQGEFARGAGWPLDARLLVVDETSMLDVELAAALLDASPDDCHLTLVGDPAQLPSIGPGRVLGDLIDAAADPDLGVPVTELTTLYRQSTGGAIARLAGAIRDGELPPVEPPGRQPEVAVLTASGGEAAARRAVALVTEAIPRALGLPASEIQVCTPVHRGPAGTVALNAALKQALNPGPGVCGGFDPGDRVVATANHLDLGFANGEVGSVAGLGPDGGLEVVFSTGAVQVPAAELADLAHGWAITVHRAQGSEWPAVVAVLPAEAGGLLSRPLVYTAFTRAQRHLSVVHACGPALARAVRQVGARPRRTRLRRLLDQPTAG